MPQPRRLAQSFLSPPPLAAMALALLPGCEASRTIADYSVPDSPAVEAAAWPRLVDGPTHAGGLEAGPDPAVGVAAASVLTEAARVQAQRAADLAGPVADGVALRGAALRARDGR